MTIGLTVECYSRWLALGTNAFGPWWMLPTTGLNATVDVIEYKILSMIHARSLLAYVRMEGQMLDIMFLQIILVIWFQRRAMNATTIGIVMTTMKNK